MGPVDKMKCLIVFGTRPEAIKMAPLVHEFSDDPSIDCKVIVTGQHREMLDQVLQLFEIIPDHDLNIMSDVRALTDVLPLIISALAPILDDVRPDFILVHGDTATTLAASLAAYYKKIRICHIEAGLRTHDLYSPWPEEGNRKLVSAITALHFAPTKSSRLNLINEGVKEENIFVVGNTVIDALLNTIKRSQKQALLPNFIETYYPKINLSKRIILVTGHRRENFGFGFIQICEALLQIAKKNREVEIVYPVHLNPNVREPVLKILSYQENIHLIEPLTYQLFVELMAQSCIILTDSGGIQEEAPSLNKPVLLMRNTTERPEAVNVGTVKLVGANTERIVEETNWLLTNKEAYRDMACRKNPYGNGASSSLIKTILKRKFDENKRITHNE